MLICSVYAGAILQFVRDNTVRVPGVGDICSLAGFDFERHGNNKYGAPVHAAKRQRSKQGKMEKSFLTFVATYPTWQPPATGRQMLVTLSQHTDNTAGAATAFLGGCGSYAGVPGPLPPQALNPVPMTQSMVVAGTGGVCNSAMFGLGVDTNAQKGGLRFGTASLHATQRRKLSPQLSEAAELQQHQQEMEEHEHILQAQQQQQRQDEEDVAGFDPLSAAAQAMQQQPAALPLGTSNGLDGTSGTGEGITTSGGSPGHASSPRVTPGVLPGNAPTHTPQTPAHVPHQLPLHPHIPQPSHLHHHHYQQQQQQPHSGSSQPRHAYQQPPHQVIQIYPSTLYPGGPSAGTVLSQIRASAYGGNPAFTSSLASGGAGSDFLPTNETEDLSARVAVGHSLLQSYYESQDMTVQHRYQNRIHARSAMFGLGMQNNAGSLGGTLEPAGTSLYGWQSGAF